MTRAPASPPRRRAAGILAVLLALGLTTTPGGAAVAGQADDTDDPNLTQTLDELAIAHGPRALESGHIDMGPKFDDDGTWRFLIHDDVARVDAHATSVWRYPTETVFQVGDAAKLAVPSDPAYAFLGADPGAEVYVVPQTQNPEVVWVGWNTQDPTVMETIDRGITLSLDGVQGPGIMTTYLQSGSFGEPQLLWDSRVTDGQSIWVDVNTHTHANWVFTAPGVYLVGLTAEADLIDGTHVSDTQRIRFAVGDGTAPEDALAAVWDGPSAGATTDEGRTASEPASTQPPPADRPLVAVLIGIIVLVAAGLVIGVTVVIVRGDRVRRRVLDARRGGDGGGRASAESDPS